eukprot:TRINITY_DN54842_c0_g1_i1.p1 TRINITY_DN54842_c0_g1~~TRINITY_DN54842_c0_g1_i1.p1  ORF type:complete len:170 (+),score=33.16 TRINITY_DN54842_c0_g1_i1:396-905(+)
MAIRRSPVFDLQVLDPVVQLAFDPLDTAMKKMNALEVPTSTLLWVIEQKLASLWDVDDVTSYGEFTTFTKPLAARLSQQFPAKPLQRTTQLSPEQSAAVVAYMKDSLDTVKAMLVTLDKAQSTKAKQELLHDISAIATGLGKQPKAPETEQLMKTAQELKAEAVVLCKG